MVKSRILMDISIKLYFRNHRLEIHQPTFKETIKKVTYQHKKMTIYCSSKQPKNSLNRVFYLQLKLSQSQMKEVIKCTFCCNSKGNEPVSLEQWGVMKLISIYPRGNLADQKTSLKENE